jgi:HK97 family phage major capsid protein
MSRQTSRRREQIVADLARTAAEVSELADRETLTDGECTRLDRLVRHGEKLRVELDEHDADREQRLGQVRAFAAAGNTTSGDAPADADPLGTGTSRSGPGLWRQRRSDPWRAPIGDDPYGETRGRAFDAIDRAGDWVPDDAKQAATLLVERAGDDLAARWAIVASDPHYLRAFAKLLADPATGPHTWSEPERDAVGRAKVVARAMSLTDAAGGFMVPFTLDPALILTGAGTINPFRRIARVEQTLTDQWAGVSTAGVSASWDAEAAEVSDDAPTLAQPTVAIHKAAAFVPYSIEVGQDAVNLVEQLQVALADARETLEGAAFATGSGSGQPFGIVTALTGTSSVVASATTDTFAVGDVYSLIEALPARFQPRAQWTANLAIVNDMRQFATGTGPQHAFVADLTAGSPPSVLGKPLHECSDMDGTITALADNYVLIVGDWRHYVIVDRVGMTVELVPHLFHTSNNRPSGQRGLYAFFRTGADSLVDGAFRVLNVT